MVTKTGLLAGAAFAILLVASLVNGMLNANYVTPEPSSPTGQITDVEQDDNGFLQPTLPENRRVVKLGYSNYAFFFPESGTDTISLIANEPVKFEAILEGENKLVGCMKSVKTPWGFKVFKPGDNTFDFTPQQTGKQTFTCGMGMGVGYLDIVN